MNGVSRKSNNGIASRERGGGKKGQSTNESKQREIEVEIQMKIILSIVWHGKLRINIYKIYKKCIVL